MYLPIELFPGDNWFGLLWLILDSFAKVSSAHCRMCICKIKGKKNRTNNKNNNSKKQTNKKKLITVKALLFRKLSGSWLARKQARTHARTHSPPRRTTWHKVLLGSRPGQGGAGRACYRCVVSATWLTAAWRCQTLCLWVCSLSDQRVSQLESSRRRRVGETSAFLGCSVCRLLTLTTLI